MEQQALEPKGSWAELSCVSAWLYWGQHLLLRPVLFPSSVFGKVKRRLDIDLGTVNDLLLPGSSC